MVVVPDRILSTGVVMGSVSARRVKTLPGAVFVDSSEPAGNRSVQLYGRILFSLVLGGNGVSSHNGV
jgi:hypothetical protein